MYFKVREHVTGVYEYAVPLDEALVEEVNKNVVSYYPEVEGITLDELCEIAAYGEIWNRPTRMAMKNIVSWETNEVIDTYERDLYEDIYDYLCEIAWEYDNSGFECYDTVEVERKTGNRKEWWIDE